MTAQVQIFDGHNDVVSKLLTSRDREFFQRSSAGHIDLPRAKEAGFAGGLFSIYVAADPQAPPPAGPVLGRDNGKEIRFPRPLELSYAQRISLAELGVLFRLQRDSAGALRVVQTVAQLEECLEQGSIAAVIHFEGAEAIDPRLEALEVFHAAGLRSLGPVWSRRNDFGEGVPYLFPHSPDTGPGLTDLGQALVRACNELGILVDVSHINEQGFWDIARISDKPLVATHSNAHAVVPNPRNLTDRQLDAVRDSGGIVGVNFALQFLRVDGGDDPDTPIAAIVEQFRYLTDRMGVDHVGFGADLDGAQIPAAVGDVTGLPRVVSALREAGFDEESLIKIGHLNWLRVLSQTWIDT
jgi:membrane dipeptidase